MIKKYRTRKEFYLFNMVIFIGFSFEFFIRGDNFLGAVLIFNGIVNLLAYQQVPRRVAPITVILNLFNFLIALTVTYNYSEIDYIYLFVLWILLAISFSFAAIRQIYSIISNKAYRKKQKRRAS